MTWAHAHKRLVGGTWVSEWARVSGKKGSGEEGTHEKQAPQWACSHWEDNLSFTTEKTWLLPSMCTRPISSTPPSTCVTQKTYSETVCLSTKSEAPFHTNANDIARYPQAWLLNLVKAFILVPRITHCILARSTNIWILIEVWICVFGWKKNCDQILHFGTPSSYQGALTRKR